MNPTTSLEPDFLPDTDVPSDTVLGDALPIGAPLNAGAYEVVRVLGRGGFGITYEACDTQSKQSVAIKEFFPTGGLRLGLGVHPQPAATRHFEAMRRKFLNEARLLASVQHASIVRVQDSFEENNTAYTVMELLEGETLLQRIEQEGALPQAEALHIIEHVGCALETVHGLEMLHLDVKPENIFMCRRSQQEDQRIVLMDFDLLQPMAGAASYRTQPLNVTTHCGTPGYAPLEQYTQGARFGTYTDIYALGATLHHVLTGQAPIASPDRAAQNERVALEVDGATRPVSEATRWAMQIQPFKRPQSVRDFLDALHGRRASTPNPSTQNGAMTTSDSTGALFAPPGAATSPTAVIAPMVATAHSTTTSAVMMPTQVPSLQTPPAPLVGSTTPADDLWYLVSVSGDAVEWPWMCACCGASPATTVFLRGGATKHEVPYCAHCSRHVQASRLGVVGGACGMGVGLVMALSGVMLSNLVLGPLGTMLHFGAMSYWGLQHSFAHDLAGSDCCDTRLAVSVTNETEQRRRWRFRNARFRDEFRQLNKRIVV